MRSGRSVKSKGPEGPGPGPGPESGGTVGTKDL